MIATSDLEILKQMRLFDHLPPEEIASVVNSMQVTTVSKGDILFRQRDEATHFYGVLSGWIQIYRDNANGERAVLSIFGRGETFAEAAMFVGGHYPATAECVEHARLCRFSRKAFLANIDADPKLCLAMLGSISQHLHHMVLQIEQLKTRSAEQRLAHFLLHLCPVGRGSCEIVLPYDKALVAGRLGMKPESLSRNLARLSAIGITVKGHTVLVGSVEALADHCRMPLMRQSRS